MRSRMTPEQLAKVKNASTRANRLTKLAEAAEGLGVTKVQREQAAKELEREVGRSLAKTYRESALRRAGAPAKGLSRFFGG
ncbi:hypothetical protein [Streptosporangium jomthongense]|uniref:Uncharacterized protein n=1 Tax=Streptosporangium jomthongense TaxID=1193683 RepID=A0ABV8EUG3_9ACTN